MFDNNANSTIFKTTFLFGFVKLINISTKIIQNKVIAILLGPSGVGLIGLYQSLLNSFKTFGGLGVNQSAIRDIAEGKNKNKISEYSKVVAVTKKITLYSGVFSSLICVCFSNYFSIYIFEDTKYANYIILLSLAILFSVIAEGYLSILKGSREILYLAKANIFAAILSVVVVLPLYIYFKEEAIVPSLIVASFFTFLISLYFLNKTEIQRVTIKFRDVFSEGKQMIKMGLSLMSSSLLAVLVDIIIRAYILRTSNIDQVGLFQVGYTIIYGYFGIVLSALFTDYYPRISAINSNNKLLEIELNKQVKVGFLILCPLIVIFILLMKFFVIMLYSEDFLATTDFIVYSIFGILITVASNPLDMILIVKYEASFFLIVSIIYRVLGLGIYIIGYKYAGLSGLGISFLIVGFIHFFLMLVINKLKYNISLSKSSWIMIVIVFLFGIFSVYISSIDNVFMKILLCALIFFISLIYTINRLKKDMGINLIKWLKSKFK